MRKTPRTEPFRSPHHLAYTWPALPRNKLFCEEWIHSMASLRDAPKKNKRAFLGIFPKGGGGGSSQFPKLFYIYRFIFLYAKTWKFWGGPVFPKVKTGSFLGGHLFPKLLKSKIHQKSEHFCEDQKCS